MRDVGSPGWLLEVAFPNRAKGAAFADQHGVSGFTLAGKTSLPNERIRFQGGGILAALCQHLGEPSGRQDYALSDVLYSLPYIHRAYNLTFSSAAELLLPLDEPQIVRSRATHEAWFVAELSGRYASRMTLKKLPSEFEEERSASSTRLLIRRKQRFDWRPQEQEKSIERYRNYHKALRSHLYYINGPQRLWYLKRGGNLPSLIPRSSTTLTFAAMHKLSELSRYTLDGLSRHFECQHNWLLSEFIEAAPPQFIDEISSEMTGEEFMVPGRASRK
jgi:hypothetical protein